MRLETGTERRRGETITTPRNVCGQRHGMRDADRRRPTLGGRYEDIDRDWGAEGRRPTRRGRQEDIDRGIDRDGEGR